MDQRDDVRVDRIEYEAALADATRYRFLKRRFTVPYAMQSWLRHMNWHPDTFAMGVDEAIDAAMKEF